MQRPPDELVLVETEECERRQWARPRAGQRGGKLGWRALWKLGRRFWQVKVRVWVFA